jgi:hypothetical protein
MPNPDSDLYRLNANFRAPQTQSAIKSEAELISKCTKAVLRQLARLKQR